MNTNTNNHKTSYSITRGLFFLIMCSVIFTVLYYSLPRQNREPAISDYIDFSEGWTTSDGSPVDFSHISGTCTVTKKLPALTHDMALFFFYKSSNVTILIDGRQIYETMQPEGFFFGKTPGASYVSLPIYREDSGRTLTLVIDNPYGDGSGKINHMYLGRSEDILISRIRDKAPGFGISFLIAHLGLAFILFYLPLHKKHIIGSEMFYLGLFALNIGIFMFLILLGTMVALMNKAGGSAAFGEWAKKHVKTRAGALLSTFLLGVLIFVDDYFNCLTVGSVMMPVTDGHKISRAKLAYIIDATAAPICMIAPISSWAAAVSGMVDEGVYSGIELFVRAIPYNYYSLLTIVFVVGMALMGFDYGPMAKHERNAIEKGDLFTEGERVTNADNAPKGSERGKVYDLLIPVIVLIICCVVGMIYVGGFFEGVGCVEDWYPLRRP